jgi:hypothetical protein
MSQPKGHDEEEYSPENISSTPMEAIEAMIKVEKYRTYSLLTIILSNYFPHLVVPRKRLQIGTIMTTQLRQSLANNCNMLHGKPAKILPMCCHSILAKEIV